MRFRHKHTRKTHTEKYPHSDHSSIHFALISLRMGRWMWSIHIQYNDAQIFARMTSLRRPLSDTNTHTETHLTCNVLILYIIIIVRVRMKHALKLTRHTYHEKMNTICKLRSTPTHSHRTHKVTRTQSKREQVMHVESITILSSAWKIRVRKICTHI